MVPSCKYNASTCNLETDQINAVFNTQTWELTEDQERNAVKRARSDPDRSEIEMSIAVDVKYLVPKKLTDNGLLMIGATALGSNKGEEGVELVSGIRARFEALEKNGPKKETDSKSSGGTGQSKGSSDKDFKHLTK